jgi:hypothetical protein
MKRLLLCALLGSLSLSTTAQTDADPSVFVRGNQIEIPAQPVQLFRGDMKLYQGAYDLSTGETMALRQIGYRLYAKVGDADPKRLIAASHNVFVSADGQMKLMLQRQDSGLYSGSLWRVKSASIASTKGNGSKLQMTRLVSAR